MPLLSRQYLGAHHERPCTWPKHSLELCAQINEDHNVVHYMSETKAL